MDAHELLWMEYLEFFFPRDAEWNQICAEIHLSETMLSTTIRYWFSMSVDVDSYSASLEEINPLLCREIQLVCLHEDTINDLQ